MAQANQNKSLVNKLVKGYCMTITIGWDDAFQHYEVELYVNGLNKVIVYARQPLQIIFLIQMMQQVHPISIGWHMSIGVQRKDLVMRLIQRYITI